jgi:hypothetical protein
VFHDIEDFGDPLPRCCVDGCDCGKRMTATELAAALDELPDRILEGEVR